MEDDTRRNMLNYFYFQMKKQKFILFHENLDQLSNLDIGFVPVLLFLIDIYFS